jgi:hypothetical protein
MYYSRTLRSRRIERALACLTAVLVLTHTLAAQAIPSFPGLRERVDAVTLDEGRVELRLFLGEASPDAVNARIADTAKDALSRIVAWFGPLPTTPLTVVDAPWPHREACSSSPGVVVVSSRWLQPERDLSLERALIAALARQPFLAFAEGPAHSRIFVDGLWRFAAVRAINDTLDGRHVASVRYFGGFVPYGIRSLMLSRRRWDPRPFVHQFDELEAAGCAAPKRRETPADARVAETTVALLALERSIGWPALQQAIATLVERFRSRSPQASDLLAIVAEQRGAVPPLFARALSAAADVDVAIEEFSSEAGDGRGAFRTMVRARVDGGDDTAIPLTVRFAGGELVREWVDLRRSQVAFEFDSPSAAVEASVDPEATILFDRDRGNNTRVRSPRLPPTAARRLLNWLMWLQDLALTGTALV